MKLFKFKRGLKEGSLYMCSAGYWAGHSFVYMDSKDETYGFLVMPSMKNEWIEKEKFEFGIKNGIIEYVERIPRFVRRTIKAKFEENAKEELQSSH